jgi:WD40 repeat protein
VITVLSGSADHSLHAASYSANAYHHFGGGIFSSLARPWGGGGVKPKELKLKERYKPTAHDGAVTCCALYSRDSVGVASTGHATGHASTMAISGSTDGSIKLWSLDSLRGAHYSSNTQYLATLGGGKEGVQCLCVVQGSRHLISGSDELR